MATDSWLTILPAPMFWCPTSELPIVFSGRPTSADEVCMRVEGYFMARASETGVFAVLMALKCIVLGVWVVAPSRHGR